jgi:hypothetical protein
MTAWYLLVVFAPLTTPVMILMTIAGLVGRLRPRFVLACWGLNLIYWVWAWRATTMIAART